MRNISPCLSVLLAICIYFTPLETAYAGASDWTYTTRPGDTIWKVSHTYLKSPNDWLKLQQYNRVQNAKRLPPGTKLRVPVAWLKSQPVPVDIIFVRGEATVTSPSIGKIRAQPGQLLELGSGITTSADSSVSLRFADGSSLVIYAESELVLDTITIHAHQGMVDTQMRLQRGRIESEVTPFSRPDSRYEITTPAAVAAVRGTEFRLAVDTSGEQLRNETTNGAVAVTSAGTTRNVPAGFGTLAKQATPPIIPKALLPPPEWQTTTRTFYQSQLIFAWRSLANAVQYRLQLAKDAAFQNMLQEITTHQTQATLLPLNDGEFFLRVRGVDNIGLEGRDAELSFNITSQLVATALTDPPMNSVLRGALLQFSWASVPGAAQYRFQLATQDNFTAPVFDTLTLAPDISLSDTLHVGNYYWQVRALNADGVAGETSKSGRFEYAKELTAPTELGAVVSRQDVALHWKQSDDPKRYQLDLARDAAFENTVRSESVSTNTLTLTDLPFGSYYWRVRGVAEDSHTSDFSTGHFDITPPSRWWLWLMLLPLFIVP